jgi:heat shock protein HslJ
MKRSAVSAFMLVLSACVRVPTSEHGLAGTWVVEDVAGRGIIDYSRIELTFEEDRQLSGSTGCNRLSASYRVHDRNVVIDAVTTTRRACVEALLHQERAFVDIIGSIDSYDFDPTGALLLESDDETRLIARREGR